MYYFILIIGLLIFPTSNCAQDDGNTTLTTTSWFWPLISICIALIFSIPCTLITIVLLCHKQTQTNDFDQSSITVHPSSSSSLSSSSSSSSCSSCSSYSIRPQHQHTRCHNHSHRSHYAVGFLSPPPPYTATEQLIRNTNNSPSIPPSYETQIITVNPQPSPPASLINLSSVASNTNHLSNNLRVAPTLDTSSSITNQSIQTFQA